MFGFKAEFKKYYLIFRKENTNFGDISFGCGWWSKGHWKRLSGWFIWGSYYYDGTWFAIRLGPFFYAQGPY